jgi:hypothetical protein
MTAFSRPWYAIVGAQNGIDVGLPVVGVLLLAVVGPTAGRFYIDVSSGVSPKQYVRSEWLVVTAVLTGSVWVLVYWAGANTWIAAGVAFVVGFSFGMSPSIEDGKNRWPRSPPEPTFTPKAARFSAASSTANHSASCATLVCWLRNPWTLR